MKKIGLLAFAFVVCASVPASAQGSGVTRVRLSCDAVGATDFSMDARYEERGTRKQLKVSFEAAEGLGFTSGQTLRVSVGGVDVGQLVLRPDTSGDLKGALRFDGRKFPFPSTFPAVTAGMGVSVETLGCDLN